MKLLSQMTKKELKTLCKSLEERYGKNSTITLKQSDFNNMWASIDRYAKENKCLQEQLKETQQELQIRINDNADMYAKLCNTLMQLEEANDIIKEYVETTPKVPNDGWHIPNYNLDNAECYLEKWGIK